MIRTIRKQEGFTLVELLIVVAIIGILAAIAIPQFAAYRERAYCGSEESDLANLAIAQEAYFVDHSLYLTEGTTGVAGTLAYTIGGFKNSPNVTVNTAYIPGVSPLPDSFTAVAHHISCTKPNASWDSSQGGLIARGTY
jgi:type IV pilus assembly protein PilA